MNIRSELVRLLAVLFAFALVGAACGGADDVDSSSDGGSSAATADDRGDGSSEGEEEAEEETGGGLSQDAVEKAVSGDDDGDDDGDDEVVTGDRTSIEGIWAEAAATRSAIVDKISSKMNSGDWGINSDNVLIGPSGFEIDLNNCPADWSNTHGLTDSEIRVG